MFFLTKFVHTLRLPPYLLKHRLEEAIKGELEKLFLDKVITDSGLCVSVYDILDIKGGFIAPGEGAATYEVEFRLIMFRPFVGEIIAAKLKEFDANGLRLSVGFFDDIYVPAHLLPIPSTFGPHPDIKDYMVWVYEFEGIKCFVDGIDEIRLRVNNITYPPIPFEQLEGSKPFAPMIITGAINDSGLGPISWWL